MITYELSPTPEHIQAQHRAVPIDETERTSRAYRAILCQKPGRLSLSAIARDIRTNEELLLSDICELSNRGILKTTPDYTRLRIHLSFAERLRLEPLLLSKRVNTVSFAPAVNLTSQLSFDESYRLYWLVARGLHVSFVRTYRYVRKLAHQQATARRHRIAEALGLAPGDLDVQLSGLHMLRFIRYTTRDGSLQVLPVPEDIPTAQGEVSVEELRLWLTGPSAPPPTRDVAARTPAASAGNLVEFFNELVAAHTRRTSGAHTATGRAVVERAVARRLLASYTYTEAARLLVYFVDGSAGWEAVQRYGMTLITFERQLPAILAEIHEYTALDHTNGYLTEVARGLKRLGLLDRYRGLLPAAMQPRIDRLLAASPPVTSSSSSPPAAPANRQPLRRSSPPEVINADDEFGNVPSTRGLLSF